ncbi:MAG: hypothetical protein E7812_07790 [Phenylobacterium sp.]|nr:MAG: hypothetical protein E7812_07790 [Phenylobacterium sp.]
MHSTRLAVVASLVLAAMAAAGSAGAATNAAATNMAATSQAYAGPAAYRTEVFWSPAERLWSGGVSPGACLRSGRRTPHPVTPRLQAASYEQDGELIGEIRSAPAMVPVVVAQARSCAVEADSATTTYALLTDAERNWGVFHNAFATCMSRNHTAQYVGSMTLWIDQRCNW